ncbi:hypothetical protein [Methanopyrus sp.]
MDGKWVPVDPTGDAGKWYCSPKFRRYVIKYDYETPIGNIDINEIEETWKKYGPQPISVSIVVVIISLFAWFLVRRLI